ncbi:hypothetical protein HKX48_008715, partial [Thoreauomyces humboldtii]
MKAGFAYVPIDSAYPSQRIQHIFQVTSPSFTLCTSQTEHHFDEHGKLSVDTPDFREQVAAHSAAPLDGLTTTQSLAYVIFTSGSTGLPKGVEVCHKSCSNLLENVRYVLGDFGVGDRLLQLCSTTFDVSVFEWMSTLTSGATLCIPTENLLIGDVLADEIEKYAITVALAPPSIFASIPQSRTLPTLKTLVIGGESCTTAFRERWCQKLKLVNSYGPAEATILVSACELTPLTKSALLGSQALPGSTWHVLDQDTLVAAPPRGTGTLFIGGVCLARGYVGQPDLTAEKFVHHPELGRIYNTGDEVRWQLDGRSLEFAGRKDRMIKLRGFRIELQEIEAALCEHPLVEQVAVVKIAEDEDRPAFLAAYVVPAAPPIYSPVEDIEAAAIDANHESQWMALYEQTYQKEVEQIESLGVIQDPTLNFKGWQSSVTGKDIPLNEMLEWLLIGVREIATLKPKKCLEIGCGTGLVMFRLLPICEKYTGVDFSQGSVDYVRSLLKHTLVKGDFSAHCSDARAWRSEARSFDTCVVNSVIQYFPTAHYLIDVIRNAVDAVADGGHIFVGDVLDKSTVNAFYAETLLFQRNQDTNIKSFLCQLAIKAETDAQLYVNNEFFRNLRIIVPRIKGVRIVLKRGFGDNEMVRYRYDVILHVGTEQLGHPTSADTKTSPFDSLGSLEAMAGYLRESRPSAWKVTSMPDSRIYPYVAYTKQLASLNPEDPLPALGAFPSAVHPKQIEEVGNALGYETLVAPSVTDAGTCDVTFLDTQATHDGCKLCRAQGFDSFFEPKAWTSYTNDPRSRANSELKTALRTFAASRLPTYMVPSVFEILHSIPLTPNGKTDYRALPSVELPTAKSTSPAAGADTKETLRNLWRELLHVDEIADSANWFNLGGHSLLSVQMKAEILRRMDVPISLKVVLEYPVFRDLLVRVQTLRGADTTTTVEVEPTIYPVGRLSRIPVSSQQERMLHQAASTSTSIDNVTSVQRWRSGDVNLDALGLALLHLIERHEVLRTIYTKGHDGRYEQTIVPLELTGSIVKYKAQRKSSTTEVVRAKIDKFRQRAFDLEAEVAIRILIIESTDGQTTMAMCIHHIASDEMSLRIWIDELSSMYSEYFDHSGNSDETLRTLPIQYADYSAAETSLRDECERVAYWKSYLADPPARLRLSGRKQIKASRDFPTAGVVAKTIPNGPQGLSRAAASLGVSPFTLALSCFHAFLHTVDGSGDVIVGIPITQRTPEVDGVFGFFSNPIPTRTKRSAISRQTDIEAILPQVLSGIRNGQDQHIPLEDLLALHATSFQPGAVHRRPSARPSHCHPLFQSFFVYGEQDLPNLRLGSVVSDTDIVPSPWTRWDLACLMINKGRDGLQVAFEYNAEAFVPGVVQAFLDRFCKFLMDAFERDSPATVPRSVVSLGARPASPVPRASWQRSSRRTTTFM